MALTITGTGCSLLDKLYTDIDFSLSVFRKYAAVREGDGGIVPGKLVFSEEFERFAGESFETALSRITGGKGPDSENLGGPAIVALINTAQLLAEKPVEVEFYGTLGDDTAADTILDIVGKTPIDIDHYVRTSGPSPSTVVLSDPRWDQGHGERAFINTIGAAWNCTPEHLRSGFWKGDVLCFGGTALVPNIHDNLTALVKKGKDNGSVTVVNTVYDFRNQNRNPDDKWPLGESDETYAFTDLLIMDLEEALRLSGKRNLEEAVSFFLRKRTGAFIITHGAESVTLYSGGGLFEKLDPTEMPVSREVGRRLREGSAPAGDTTGCGDNFAGGVIASLASQLEKKGGSGLDMTEAVAWGVCSGGFACFYTGGTYLESTPGVKIERITELLGLYREQTGGSFQDSL
jgi:sugar/nucleoside kinase (ribokinase family)